MPWIPAAIGAAGTIGGGLLSSSATKSAAKESANVQREATQQQRELADRSREDLMPWAETGRNALLATSNLSGLNGPDAAHEAMGGFTASPGYEYARDEALRGVERRAAATGTLRSGNTLRALTGVAEGLASQDFGIYYNRLADLAKGGQAAAAGQQQASSVLSGEIGKNAAGVAQTIASAGGAEASIYGRTASGVGDAVQSGFANDRYLQQVGGGQPRNALYDESVFGGAGTSVGGYENAGW